MTRKEMMRQNQQIDTLHALGFTVSEADALRRISLTLHRWHEAECGNSNDYCSYAIERDEQTEIPYWVTYSHSDGKQRRVKIADREKGARKRLGVLMRDHGLRAYIQTDPRGCALYILRPGDVPGGKDAESYYNRGIAVY